MRAAGLALLGLLLAVPAVPAAAAADPTISIYPQPVAAGAVATVSGTGFCGPPCSAVLLTVDGRDVATAEVSSAGVFSRSFTVPPSGGRSLEATQLDSSGRQRHALVPMRVEGVEDEAAQEARAGIEGPLATESPGSDLLSRLEQAQRDLASPQPAQPVPLSPGARPLAGAGSSSDDGLGGLWLGVAGAGLLAALVVGAAVLRSRSRAGAASGVTSSSDPG